jgi:stearoyl-CoA desaturase (Delta-9 desaturase)
MEPMIAPAETRAAEEKAVEEEAVPVGTVRAGTSRISQTVTLIAVVVPPLGVVSAMGLLWGVGFHWVDVALFLGLYVVCAFGTTVGFHRYFTHKGFEARPPVKALLAILGCMTMQGPVTQWVTDHRKHHALSDKPGDPHSPHVGHGDGALGALRGFLHAHVGWMFSNLGMEQGRAYGRDLYEDRLVRTIDRMYLLWVVLTLGIPFGIGYAVGGTWQAGLEALVWGGLIRIAAYQHATFSVNSICHMFGRQDYRSRDEARNNWLVALLVFGEGWHNNHHAFPASARHGLDPRQIDVSWWVIKGLEKVGLVWNVRVPDRAQRERRRVQPVEG